MTEPIKLPPLPEGEDSSFGPYSVYTAEQMHAYAIAAIEADRQTMGEPVLYQSRTRPIWAGASKHWPAWENCTKDQANDYKRVKVLHDWEYEVRELYTAPQIPEGYRLCLIPKEGTNAFNAACSIANQESMSGTGPCGVFIAGLRAMLEAAPKT